MAAVPTIGRASGVERSPAAPEADATRALYERYSRQILNYCVHQLNSREEAEDAVQTTFMNAFRGLKRGIVPEAEQAWLFKIAENVCLSRRRSSWRRGKVESPNDFEVLQEIVPSKHANRADELIGLEEALEGMPENQRRAILLREWQGLSYREIADELELSQAAVETLIFRARRSLAAGLENPAPPKKRRRISAAIDGVNLGSVIATLKSMLTGGAAIKAVAVAVAAGSATVAATQAEPALVHRMHHTITPAATVHVTRQSQATFSPQATMVAGSTGMSVVQANRKTNGGVSLHDAVLARDGHGSFAQVPTEDATRTATPPMVPSAPAPTTPAPETPVAATPSTPVATPAEPTRPEPSTPAKTGNGNEGKNEGKNDNPGNGNATSKKADDTPKSEPSRGNGNGNSDPMSDAPKSEPVKADEPKSDAPKSETPKGKDDNNGNGNDKKAEKADEKKAEPTRALSAPAAVTVTAAPAAPVVPAPQENNGNGNGNDKDKDKGKGADKKQEAPAPTPVAPAAAAPAAPAPQAPAAAPPVQPTNPPMHGNGNGNSDNDKDKDKSDKGKGK
jgi:RNA polymerase sigma-70 factor (ECF subfamily)